MQSSVDGWIDRLDTWVPSGPPGGIRSWTPQLRRQHGGYIYTSYMCRFICLCVCVCMCVRLCVIYEPQPGRHSTQYRRAVPGGGACH